MNSLISMKGSVNNLCNRLVGRGHLPQKLTYCSLLMKDACHQQSYPHSVNTWGLKEKSNEKGSLVMDQLGSTVLRLNRLKTQVIWAKLAWARHDII